MRYDSFINETPMAACNKRKEIIMTTTNNMALTVSFPNLPHDPFLAEDGGKQLVNLVCRVININAAKARVLYSKKTRTAEVSFSYRYETSAHKAAMRARALLPDAVVAVQPV